MIFIPEDIDATGLCDYTKNVASLFDHKPPPARKSKLRQSGKQGSSAEDGYTAADIEILEGLEPVRRRPGMYIGGTDEKAMHHLFAEILDNAMDEAIAGHAGWIDVNLDKDGYLTVTDNGRGIPIDPHPKFSDKSALEVIMTTLHAGGKFDSNAYETSGGLHGVGVSVVNALSAHMEVEVARGRKLYRQTFSRGTPESKLDMLGEVSNRRGTKVRFLPDPDIFGRNTRFKPKRLLHMARSKAYLFSGLEIRWSCAPEICGQDGDTPEKAVFHFPGGLKDFLASEIEGDELVTDEIFSGKTTSPGKHESVEWAIAWRVGEDGSANSYCNAIPTPGGGTHEAGLRTALLRGLRNHGELIGDKKAAQITGDDVLGSIAFILSIFIREPEFQGQTKEKLATQEAGRIVEQGIRDPFDHWLAGNPAQARKLLDWVIDRAEERMRRREEKNVTRKSATRKLRLPGKLTDCSLKSAQGAELFIVEGDSAGGSAKLARNRTNQAILPLRGKILNVANAGGDKINANQQLSDLVQALGCGIRAHYREEDLRYEKVIIMTDADIDGAHIASLLITFFFREMPQIIHKNHLYLAVPPLYRLTQDGKTTYARDDAHKDKLLAGMNGRGKVEIGRFKGLGEMMPRQLKETTMDPGARTLLRVTVQEDKAEETASAVERLMGSKVEPRFAFIQEHARFADADELDI